MFGHFDAGKHELAESALHLIALLLMHIGDLLGSADIPNVCQIHAFDGFNFMEVVLTVFAEHVIDHNLSDLDLLDCL